MRCTYCGGRGALLEVDLRGVRYDYCDAACATAHRQAVELRGGLCPDCGEEALGDSWWCGEHLSGPADPVTADAGVWRKAG